MKPVKHEKTVYDILEERGFIEQTTDEIKLRELLKEKVITGKHLVMDSCPILANVRENNLKTAVANRFDKTRIPKGDPDARMGILIHFPQPFKKEIRYFWGYRNISITDIRFLKPP